MENGKRRIDKTCFRFWIKVEFTDSIPNEFAALHFDGTVFSTQFDSLHANAPVRSINDSNLICVCVWCSSIMLWMHEEYRHFYLYDARWCAMLCDVCGFIWRIRWHFQPFTASLKLHSTIRPQIPQRRKANRCSVNETHFSLYHFKHWNLGHKVLIGGIVWHTLHTTNLLIQLEYVVVKRWTYKMSAGSDKPWFFNMIRILFIQISSKANVIVCNVSFFMSLIVFDINNSMPQWS